MQATPYTYPLLLAALIVLGFALNAGLAGWWTLASRYRAREDFRGARREMQSVRFRTGTFHGCITVGADTTHLYLGMLAFFRIGYPPLLIPWRDVSARTRQGFLKKEVVLTFANRESPIVALPLDLAEWVAAQTDGSFTLPSPPPDKR